MVSESDWIGSFPEDATYHQATGDRTKGRQMGRQRQQQRSDASVSQLLNALGHLLRHLFGLITLGLFMITAVALPLPAPLTIALIAWLFISWVIYLVKNQYKREGTR